MMAPEPNVHRDRMRRQAAKYTTDELVRLYGRLPEGSRGRRTARQNIVRDELEGRGLSLRDLGIDQPRGGR